MSIINIRDISFSNSHARFLDPYVFRITFECIAPLKEGECPSRRARWESDDTDVEWKLLYVASPGNQELDQELDDCCVGPVPVGISAFNFEANPPSPAHIPKDDVLGVAALILTGSYNDQEFVRVGYYQNTEYDNEEMNESPPDKIRFDRLVRDLSDKPRVTRYV